MAELKEIVKRIPGALPTYHFMEGISLRRRTPGDIFTEIFRRNLWRGAESVSGLGSSLAETAVIARELPVMWRDLGVHTVLDVPCGDFHWMSRVNMNDVEYTGADIVEDLVRQNARYEQPNVHFRKLDLMSDTMPKVDFVFCRDCLGHLCFRDAFAALHNIHASGSTYLLVSTNPTVRRNINIATGQSYWINLQAAPFFLPPPIKLVDDKCGEPDKPCKGKMALWKVAAIAECPVFRVPARR